MSDDVPRPRRALQHSGWLHKEGHRVNTAFKRRWFTLTTDRRLSYYESEAAAGRGQKPKGVVHVCSLAHACPRDISGAIDARPREHHAHAVLLARAFTFQTDEAKPFVVFAESTREKVTWMQALLSGLGGSSLALPVEQLATLRRPSELGPPQRSSVASSSSDEAAQRKKAPPAGCGGSEEEEEGGREAAARGAAPSRAIDADSERLTAHESPHESQLSEAFLWLKVDLALDQAARGEAEEARATLTSVLGGYHARAGEGLPFPAGLSEEGTMHALYKPEWLVALHELGKLECAEGRYADAAPSFQGALRIAPPERRTQLRLQCAWCAWHMRLDEPAESLYARELRRDPLCWAAMLDRARFRLERAAWGLALSDLELVVAMGQAAADVLNDLGVCRFELGEPGKAMEDFEAALEADEQHAHATLNRGNCHRLAGRLAEARADYSRATSLDPRLVAAFNNRGALSLVEGRHADAVADLEEAVRIDPHSEVALQNCELAAAASERTGLTLNERVGVTSVLRPDEASDLLAAREGKAGVARRASLSGRQLASSG